MNFNFIDYELTKGVARLTLDRPDKLNSFNDEMAEEMKMALARVASDDAVRAVLLTGAGRAFCAGQDLADVVPDGEEPLDLGAIVRASYNPIISDIRHTEKPFVAAVNGVAAGAGANLALACDFVLASDKATFIQSFARVGLVPDSGGTFMLPRLVGMARATAMAMLAEKLSAKEAQELGLIYAVHAPEALLEAAEQLATRLASMPTKGLGLIKRALNQSFSNDLDAQLDLEADLQQEAGYTADYAEGVDAFLNKRMPQYQGK